jgi:putative ABC transport system permease protein
MEAFHRIVRGVQYLLFRSRQDQELDEEIRLHIELETEKNVREGKTPAEARRKALMDFGGVERFKEATREARPSRPVEDLLRDLRYAGRRILRDPGTSATVILCLGLGLGAIAGVFSFFFGIVLRPLPFAEADRLAILFETAPGFTRASPTFDDFEGWRENATTFAGLGAYSRTRRTLTAPEGPEILDGTRVSHDLFGILGIMPALGRGFTPEDDGPGAAPTVILSHRLWEERYAGERAVLGSGITLDGSSYTVVGVMARGFAFPEEARFWVPLRTAVTPGGGSLTAVLGRFAEGVTLEGARADMDRVAALMREAYPESNAQREIAVRPLEEDFLWGLKTPVTLFLMVAGFVLLLATANVTNLLLAQGTTRTREMVVRTALGAGRGRILRQLFAESVLLALAGGTVGLVLGIAGRNLYLSFVPEDFPYYLHFELDAPALALLILITLGTGLFVGLAPALATTRVDLFAALRGGGEGASPSGEGPWIDKPILGGPAADSGARWPLLPNPLRSVPIPRGGGSGFRGVLMTLQTALALAVLVGSGMMARSLGSLKQVSPGLDPENLLTLQVALPEGFRGDEARQRLAFDEIRERVAGIPGVTAAAVVSNLPIAGAAAGTFLHVEGTQAPPPGEEPWVINKQAQPGYFGTAGIRLLAGRDFRSEDGASGSPPVVIVNEGFALRYWPEGEALGKRIKYGRPESEYPWMEVIGVVGNVRHFGPERPVELGIYEPFQQLPYWRESLVVRTAGDPRGVIPNVMAEVRAVDPNAPVYNVFTMEEILYRSYWRPAVLSRLLWIFTGIALVLAALGIYGVVAFSTAQRRREFGIRMALGAEKGVVLRHALRTTLLPCSLGLVAGLLVAWAGIRFAGSLLYEVESIDPGVALVAAAVMGLIALAAVLVPAGKAAGLDPAGVLRGE